MPTRLRVSARKYGLTMPLAEAGFFLALIALMAGAG